ncbi:MAG: hypothetical protein EP338_03880 [Bacteroidetes bacterium]|nr:MAG: hypothetical protein EP338_03880 [Bacteroidota bacterium]
MRTKEIEHIIQKAISGNASESESNALKIWLDQSEENRVYYEEQLLLWKFAGVAKKKGPSVNVQSAWERFEEAQKEEESRKSGFAWYRIAAVLIVFLIAGGLAFYFYQDDVTPIKKFQAKTEITPPVVKKTARVEPQIESSQEDSIVPVVKKRRIRKKKAEQETTFQDVFLPDSSLVKLANNSVLDFLDYTQEQRVVSLSGAGFFNVKPMNQDFVIETKQLMIRVEGTKFDVQTETEDHPFIDLFVEEGRMVAYEIANPSNKVVLTSNEAYIYDIKTHEFIPVKVPEDISRWKQFVNKIFKKKNKKKSENN